MRTYRKKTVFGLLIGAWVALIGWQLYEHSRATEASRQALTNRARDISYSLAVVIRSQGRFGVLWQPRLEDTLEGLAKSQELISVALLNWADQVVASAGEPTNLNWSELAKRGEVWGRDRVTFVNPIDLGAASEEGGTTRSMPLIITEGREENREDDRRRSDKRGPPPPPPRPMRQSIERTSESLLLRLDFPLETTSQTLSEFLRDQRSRPDSDRGPHLPPPLQTSITRTSDALVLDLVFPADAEISSRTLGPPPGRDSGDRGRRRSGPPPWFGRPMGMDEARYQELLQKQGLHGFVLVMSTDTYRAESRRDLWLRLVIIGVALVAAFGLGLAWRNVDRSANLQLRLVRASEMNSHLREMNLAAAGLAHETRNPLNIVRGVAQLIARQSDASSEIKNRANQITEEVDRVTGRLNEFIEYSRPREAKPGPVDFAALVEDVARTLETDREEKAVEFHYEGLRITVEADELLLRQVLFNLLLNAVQAVEKGGRIEVAADRSNPDGGWFEVRDTGPGVPANMREDIFRPYISTHGSGAGLGLAVVRQIVHAHGWDIAYVPSSNGGAGFRVSGLKVVSRNA